MKQDSGNGVLHPPWHNAQKQNIPGGREKWENP